MVGEMTDFVTRSELIQALNKANVGSSGDMRFNIKAALEDVAESLEAELFRPATVPGASWLNP